MAIKRKALSAAEEGFALAIRAFKHPVPEREYVFLPDRKYRFDFAWPDRKVALEIEGGTYSKGKSRHTTGVGFDGDCVKYALAIAAGWKVYRFSSNQVNKGVAMMFMEGEFRKWEKDDAKH